MRFKAFPIAALCAAFAAPASAQLINPSFDTVGPNGATVTTLGAASPPPYSAWKVSAADGWQQFTVVPNGSLTTTLLQSTDPWGGGNMLHVETGSGAYAPAEMGNGFGQFFGGALYADATLSYDIQVLSGQVTGGLTLYTSPGIGVFTDKTPVNNPDPNGNWVHVTDHFTGADLAAGVFFETLTPNVGAVYNIDNMQFSGRAVPEPATWAMLLAGFVGLGVAGYSRRAALRA